MTARVFVSSTMGPDMTPWREAAIAGIESIPGNQALDIEGEPATPDTPRDACLTVVSRADAVVLLLGNRYGAIKASGFSATEEETRHARNVGKPILAFDVSSDPDEQQIAFRDRLYSWAGGRRLVTCEQPHNLQQEVVRALLNEKGEEPSPELADLANDLLTCVLPDPRHGVIESIGPQIALSLAPTRRPQLQEATFFSKYPEFLQDLTVTGATQPSDSRLSAVPHPDHIDLASRNRCGQSRLVLRLGLDGSLAVVNSFRFPGGGLDGSMDSMMYAKPSLAAEALDRLLALSGQIYQRIDQDGLSPRAYFVQVGIGHLGMANFSEPPNSSMGGTPVRMRNDQKTLRAYSPARQVERSVLYDSSGFATEVVQRLQRLEQETPAW